nr:hypothetical protein Q903MT_gene4997 [Picea sitchensis]
MGNFPLPMHVSQQSILPSHTKAIHVKNKYVSLLFTKGLVGWTEGSLAGKEGDR